MGKRVVRGRRLVGVGLVLVGGSVLWAGWVYFLPSRSRSETLAYGQFVLALVGAVITVLGWFRGAGRADPRSVGTLADLLALEVGGQWRKEAFKRTLVTPAPIPVGWSLSDLPVAGPVEAAVGVAGMAPGFSPLPGQTRVTEDQLRTGGGRAELFAVYAGIASGRMVVVGAPGSGKSATAIMLLLDALDHRDHVDDTTRVPVPVLFTTHGWDPPDAGVPRPADEPGPQPPRSGLVVHPPMGLRLATHPRQHGRKRTPGRTPGRAPDPPADRAGARASGGGQGQLRGPTGDGSRTHSPTRADVRTRGRAPARARIRGAAAVRL